MSARLRAGRYIESFIGIPKKLFFKNVGGWWQLRPGSRDLYLLLKAKWNGEEERNGKLWLPYAEILKLRISGLRSSKAISAALKDLERAGWIKRELPGGLYRNGSNYRLTWEHDDFHPPRRRR
jgi:hypothetical protein